MCFDIDNRADSAQLSMVLSVTMHNMLMNTIMRFISAMGKQLIIEWIMR